MQFAGLAGCDAGFDRGRCPSAQQVRRGRGSSAGFNVGIVPQGGGVVAVLVAGRDHQQAEADDVSEAVPDLLRRSRVIEAGGLAIGDTEAALDLFQRQHAAI